MVARLLRPSLQSIFTVRRVGHQTFVSSRASNVRVHHEPFTKQEYKRITQITYRQRIFDDFKNVPIAKDYLKARRDAKAGSFDRLQEFKQKYSQYGFNENIPFYLYPRFVYIICTSNKARLHCSCCHTCLPTELGCRNPPIRIMLSHQNALTICFFIKMFQFYSIYIHSLDKYNPLIVDFMIQTF